MIRTHQIFMIRIFAQKAGDCRPVDNVDNPVHKAPAGDFPPAGVVGGGGRVDPDTVLNGKRERTKMVSA